MVSIVCIILLGWLASGIFVPLQAQKRVALPPVGERLLYRFGDSNVVIGTKQPDTLKGILFGMVTDTARNIGEATQYNFGAFLLPRLDSSQIRRHLNSNKVTISEAAFPLFIIPIIAFNERYKIDAWLLYEGSP